ncbi:MAG: hypothetical protein EB127_31755 [Alphaproteobacteria bacterium]|nr:hypothetical protein [Alphaproteobacteria bacterium]
MQKIGNIFINPLELNLIPGLLLTKGLYQVTMSSTLIRLDDPYSFETQNSSWHSRSDMNVMFGDDVHSVVYTINSIDGYSGVYKHFRMTKSELILLNLANRFLNKPLVP